MRPKLTCAITAARALGNPRRHVFCSNSGGGYDDDNDDDGDDGINNNEYDESRCCDCAF